MAAPIAADGGASGTVTNEAVTPGEVPEGSDVQPQSGPNDVAKVTDEVTAEVTPGEAAPVAETDDEKAAREQRAADVAWYNEHPGEVLIRAANPAVGGEAF